MKQYTNLSMQVLLLIVTFSALALTGLPLLVQAGPELPPRDTPPPGTPASDDDDDNDQPAGAYILLQSGNGAWATVQWQDSAGGWQNVAGWNGALEGGAQQWWVHPKDFNTGPFRWIVTQGPGGEPVGISEPFNLPGGANEIVRVTIN